MSEVHHEKEVNPLQERQDRIKKLNDLKEAGIQVYPEKFDKTHMIAALLAIGSDESKIKTMEEIVESKEGPYKIAGRITLFRTHGKIAFAKLLDDSGEIQICFKQDLLEKENFKLIEKKFDVADFAGIQGELFLTQKGELTLLATEVTFLGKALRPLPAKFHGLKDKETIYRQRYLDLIANKEAKKRFEFRSDFVKELRNFYWNEGFREVETPILTNTASGALATPFKTHHNALDTELYLRIAPETYLKEAVIGGFEKVFEIGRLFRNEGIDPSHLQDFTTVEHYAAYWNYEDNMAFTEKMFEEILIKLRGTTKATIKDHDGVAHEVDFKGPWPKKSIRDLIFEDSRIDIDTVQTADQLREEIAKKDIKLEKATDLGLGNLIDTLYKKVSRPKLISPTFITKHPIQLSPLARKNDENPNIVDRFQLVVGTWEVVNAYSELVDPIDQAERFELQSQDKDAGDEEAHGKDDEYVEAMEYGMPPISGFGMGIDRIVTLLTEQDNLRDVILFPLMKPKHGNQEPKED